MRTEFSLGVTVVKYRATAPPILRGIGDLPFLARTPAAQGPKMDFAHRALGFQRVRTCWGGPKMIVGDSGIGRPGRIWGADMADLYVQANYGFVTQYLKRFRTKWRRRHHPLKYPINCQWRVIG